MVLFRGRCAGGRLAEVPKLGCAVWVRFGGESRHALITKKLRLLTQLGPSPVLGTAERLLEPEPRMGSQAGIRLMTRMIAARFPMFSVSSGSPLTQVHTSFFLTVNA